MIRIYGHSDDVIEIDGAYRDELGAYDKRRIINVADGEGHGVRVLAEYAPGEAAVWRLSVEPLDEDVPCPWPIRVVPAHGYSLAVEIDCPDAVSLSYSREDCAAPATKGGNE